LYRHGQRASTKGRSGKSWTGRKSLGEENRRVGGAFSELLGGSPNRKPEKNPENRYKKDREKNKVKSSPEGGIAGPGEETGGQSLKRKEEWGRREEQHRRYRTQREKEKVGVGCCSIPAQTVIGDIGKERKVDETRSKRRGGNLKGLCVQGG